MLGWFINQLAQYDRLVLWAKVLISSYFYIFYVLGIMGVDNIIYMQTFLIFFCKIPVYILDILPNNIFAIWRHRPYTGIQNYILVYTIYTAETV